MLNGFAGSFARSYHFTPLWKVSASLLTVGTTLLSQMLHSCLNKIYMEDEEDEYMQQEEEGKGKQLCLLFIFLNLTSKGSYKRI